MPPYLEGPPQKCGGPFFMADILIFREFNLNAYLHLIGLLFFLADAIANLFSMYRDVVSPSIVKFVVFFKKIAFENTNDLYENGSFHNIAVCGFDRLYSIF